MTPIAGALARRSLLRLALLAAFLFALSAGLLLFYVYASTARVLNTQADRAVQDEMTILLEAGARGGLNGLNRELILRSLGDNDFLYVLTYPDGRRVSGDFDGLPVAFNERDPLVVFTYEVDDGEGVNRRHARGRVAEVTAGYRLFVGVDVDENVRVVQGMVGNAWIVAGLVLVLALALGLFVANRFALRIGALNDVAEAVRGGDLTARAPRNFANDELDRLSDSLNTMLDRIEQLMSAMRHAGDSIAHDMRTPLTRLRNKLEAAKLDRAADASKALDTALSDADELLGTFNAVLRLARLQAGEKRPPLVQLDGAEVAGDLAELYEPVCEDAGIEFSAEIDATLPLRGDRALIAQAMANLLDNSVKYTPEGAAIMLRARARRRGGVELSVTDTGPGIPAGDRERVRQRFVRLDRSRTAPGIGLGLTLVQTVADIHGAEFVLEDGPGGVDGALPGLRAALRFPPAGG